MKNPAKKSAAKKAPKRTPLAFKDVVTKLLETKPEVRKGKSRD